MLLKSSNLSNIPNIFTALSEPRRFKIIEMIAKVGQLPASAISKKFKVTPSAISQHLKVLREAKLVRVEKRAQQRIYTINPTAISEIQQWSEHMTQLWNDRFDALDKVLKDM